MTKTQLSKYYSKLEKRYFLAKHQLDCIKLSRLGYITDSELNRLYPNTTTEQELDRLLPILSNKVWEIGNLATIN